MSSGNKLMGSIASSGVASCTASSSAIVGSLLDWCMLALQRVVTDGECLRWVTVTGHVAVGHRDLLDDFKCTDFNLFTIDHIGDDAAVIFLGVGCLCCTTHW